MARLPYPFKGSPRFVVDSESVVTDQRQEFLDSVTEYMERDSTRWLIWDPPSYYGDVWNPPPDRPAGRAEQPQVRYTTNTFLTIDEVASFDQEELDRLVADSFKRERQRKEIAVLAGPAYTGNPNCIFGIEGCTCGTRTFVQGRWT